MWLLLFHQFGPLGPVVWNRYFKIKIVKNKAGSREYSGPDPAEILWAANGIMCLLGQGRLALWLLHLKGKLLHTFPSEFYF